MTTALTQKAPAPGTPAEKLAEIAPELAPLLERMAADPNARVALLEQLLGVNACRQIGIYPIPPGFKLSVVIPVYNEERWLAELVRRVQAVEIPKELILVNDFSKDGTPAILAQLEKQYDNVRVFHQPKNMGKGAALREGFKHCTGDLVIVQDADWEYDPAEYPKLIQPILDGRADVVIGSRFIGESHRVLYYWHSVGNKVLTTLSNWCTNLNLTDMETCYKVFKREIIQGMTLKSDRFGFEPEVTAKIARRRKGQPRWRIFEVPISYSGRTYEEGKKIGMKDGFQALYCIIRYWLAD
ncbi:Glycosyl transferase family 2 OS=Isosphaera pallida (strain ATCC 43644 / DSM 9630 / IS1B) GN=Isop_3447 PE=4 SV=1: Glycos_transf_2 [Gemmata massiliana]|uniref:Glycosyltransferase 2-like domain-containing protein n=1 Tax=Gemmata massiliana TaxID=1210884 RepID=A0A6P2CR22_9BACT|nr:glycosyltransferase family 2 protein [Gemmata massiliana]VTR91329.1 Glycosyl transferase family 2 OS=Isosphaera pallida (strain ATCC 43644 / DSM 9630 / IS1B) GN=Isop_3447 PE=4 SV=1: Glycos_transf_2 [Gemmata massiliana]